MRDQTDTPKSEKSERTIAIGRLAGELFEHRGRSAFQGDDERVFCHPTTGGPMMARAGRSDFKTTQGYIDLAGETFARNPS